MARRRINVFGLSFLDAMTCGFGAVILFYMVINAAVGRRAGKLTADLKAEVNKLEVEVLDGYKKLVELRNAVRVIEQDNVEAHGRSRRVIDELQRIQEELATYSATNLSKREHVNKLQSDLRSLEQEVKRLQAQSPSDEDPGDRVRAFVGDGDRQYLTGLKVGGRRIMLLLDASASMLDETIVNIIRRRNLAPAVRRRADKWVRAVKTVDWLTTQLPAGSRFQIYSFNTLARSVVKGSDGTWLDSGDREALDGAVTAIRQLVPTGGTSLIAAFDAIKRMNPRPDNLTLVTDGLPTRGRRPPSRRTVSSDARFDLFRQAVKELPRGIPVNVILLPIEGDPLAASGFWKLAIQTGGSFLAPSKDWP